VFGLGMMEIGLIIALAVMLFPPKELPKLARSIARLRPGPQDRGRLS